MDIDIDFPTTFDPLDIFDSAVRASMVSNGELKKHTVGVYFQNIPKDKITGLSAIPYEQAEELGYTKIDFLHLAILDAVSSKQELRELINTEPNWDLLRVPSIVQKLFQIHKHYDVVETVKPKSVQELADVIALIRPGKRFLLEKYTENPKQIRPILYAESEGYYYKKSHAVSYALTIVLQLHLIEKGVL